MDFTMLLLIGIFIYLAIGYIFVLWAGAYEDSLWEQIKVILFWPILWIALIVCYIVFAYIEMRNHIKKKNYENKIY